MPKASNMAQFSALKGATGMMILVLLASPQVYSEELQVDTCLKRNKKNALSTKRFGSPWDLIRDVDELFDQKMHSELNDFYHYPRLLGNLMDRSALDHFRPRLLSSDATFGTRLASPSYEITESESEFKLAVDVPGVKVGDMKIKLEQDGRVLRLTGERKIQDGNFTSEIKFEKAFLLDKKIQADKITANLSDGVVIITAPKVLTEQKNEIEIPITEINHGIISVGEEAEGKINIST